MSRARNIKPSFFTNDILAECDMASRLLFIGLWTIADREGRLEDRPKKIKAEILPYDDCDCESLLQQLSGHGFIHRYEARGNKYIQILNFVKHQNPHIKEAASTIPESDQPRASMVRNVPLTDSPLLIPPSPTPQPIHHAVELLKKDTFVLPPWVDSEAWKSFDEMRKKIPKCPFTDKAKHLVIRELETLTNMGHDPTAVLEQSIKNSWKDVYPIKENYNGKSGTKQTKLDLIAEGVKSARAQREREASGKT